MVENNKKSRLQSEFDASKRVTEKDLVHKALIGSLKSEGELIHRWVKGERKKDIDNNSS
jgi:hypothetical protein